MFAHLLLKILIWNRVTDNFTTISTPVNLSIASITMSRTPLVATIGALDPNGIRQVRDQWQLDVLLLTF